MWNDKWGEKPWQYDDKYLVSLANELNSKCEKQKAGNRSGIPDIE